MVARVRLKGSRPLFVESSLAAVNTAIGGWFSKYPINIFGRHMSGKTLLALQEGCKVLAETGGNILFIDVDGGLELFANEWLPKFAKRFGFEGEVIIEEVSSERRSEARKYVTFNLPVFELFGVRAKVKISEKGKAEFYPWQVCKSKVEEYIGREDVRWIVIDSVLGEESVWVRDTSGYVRYVPIDDLFDELPEKVRHGDRIIALNTKGYEIFTRAGWSGFLGVMKHEISDDVLEIETKAGTVTVTKGHSIVTKRDILRGDEVVKGDELIVSQPVLPAEPITELDLKELITYDGVAFTEHEVVMKRGGGYGRTIPRYFELDELNLTVLGFLLAEGCISSDGYLTGVSGVHEPEARELIEEFAERLGVKVKFKDKYGSPFDAQITNKLLSLTLKGIGFEFRKVGVSGKGSRRRKIPDLIFNLSKQQKAWFLRGLFSGDGGVYEDPFYGVVLHSAYKPLADGVLALLHDLGIKARVLRTPPKICRDKNGRVYRSRGGWYIEIIDAESVVRYAKLIGFVQEERNKTLREIAGYLLHRGRHGSKRKTQIVRRVRRYRYEGPVYDILETSDNLFVAGRFLVHNSFSQIFKDAFPGTQSLGARACAENMLFALLKDLGRRYPRTFFILNHHQSLNPREGTVTISGGSAVIQNSKVTLYIDKFMFNGRGYLRLYTFRWADSPEWSLAGYAKFTDEGLVNVEEEELEEILSRRRSEGGQ